ncbi:YmaF family protein [Clostridium beijerinckii]|uniref:YmaF family protein n=1 Tax=Clostridium beijerinckii TaxID=1520 RepID=UPI00047D113C|nr:YmaF family protein [Clostridium beijerinckii]
MENNYNNYGSYNNQNQNQANKKETHNHEFQSSVDYVKDDEGMEHSHRMAGVTGPSIRYGQSHVHKVMSFIDTSTDHYHEINDTTGPALYLNGKKHVHLLSGKTSYDDGHTHNYYFTTLIEDPTSVPEDSKSK